MATGILQKLVNKTITREALLQKVKDNFDLLPAILDGVSSSKASIRYSCAKILMDLSEECPDELYPYFDVFIDLLDSKYRILIWNAMEIIANLTKVDIDKKFDTVFEKYYTFINNQYMVTVANVVGHSGKIVSVKPSLVDKITHELLKVENISTTPHLTEEYKKAIAEKAITSFDKFFDQVKVKTRVIAFVKKTS